MQHRDACWCCSKSRSASSILIEDRSRHNKGSFHCSALPALAPYRRLSIMVAMTCSSMSGVVVDVVIVNDINVSYDGRTTCTPARGGGSSAWRGAHGGMASCAYREVDQRKELFLKLPPPSPVSPGRIQYSSNGSLIIGKDHVLQMVQ